MPTRNVFLSEQVDSFIATGIEQGRYSNASEVVREGLRLLQQRDAEDRVRVEWLRGAAQQGIDAIERGEYVTLNLPQSHHQTSTQAEYRKVKRSTYDVALTTLADGDFLKLMKWSVEQFGSAAAD